MNFTEEDIKNAFRLGWNSTDKYAKQKGYPTTGQECIDYLITKKGSEKSSDISHSIIGRYCQKLDKYSEENQMKYQSKTNDQERSITAGMILATKKIANELRELINDQ